MRLTELAANPDRQAAGRTTCEYARATINQTSSPDVIIGATAYRPEPEPMPLPFDEHPLRHTLSNEVHARPPVPMHSPEAVTYLAFVHHDGSAGREPRHIAELAAQLGLPAPDCESGHVFLDAGELRFKWERHNEF